jgi:hypothetical protein
LSDLRSVQTGYVAHPAPGPIGIRTLATGRKRSRHEADPRPQSSVEVSNGGLIFSIPFISSWHSAFPLTHKLHSG